MDATCILLNGDFSYLCQIRWKKAMGLLFSEKAKVLKYSDRVIRGVNKVFRAPAVMVLVKIVRSVYRNRVPFSKKNVLLRDRYTCAYCGRKPRNLTIDHIIPLSKGGKTDFDNCVACCAPCNHRKGARTPREAGMRLSRRPYQPTITEFMNLRLRQSGAYQFLQDIGLYPKVS